MKEYFFKIYKKNLTKCSCADLSVKKNFKDALPSVFLLTSVFMIFFITRLAIAPILTTLQTEMHFTYTKAGRLFLFVAFGGSIGLFSNPFLTKLITHHKNISLACFFTGIANLNIFFATSYLHLSIALFFMGVITGFYFPSGLTTITSITKSKDWGKMLSIHDLAPNLAYIITPLIAEFVMLFLSWRYIFLFLAIVQIALSVIYSLYMDEGKFCGKKPDILLMKQIVKKKLFYILIFVFCVAVSAAVGLYTILSLFLTAEHNIARETANQILSISRILGLFITIFFGVITDKLGMNFTLKVFFVVTGITTVLLGICSGKFLIAIVIIQASSAVCFFPTAFAFISKKYGKDLRSTAISLITPISTLCGIGITPALFGFFADLNMFNEAFIILGCLIFISGYIFLPIEKWEI